MPFRATNDTRFVNVATRSSYLSYRYCKNGYLGNFKLKCGYSGKVCRKALEGDEVVYRQIDDNTQDKHALACTHPVLYNRFKLDAPVSRVHL